MFSTVGPVTRRVAVQVDTGVTVTYPDSTGGSDPDAQAYITAVEAADGQALELGVRVAINEFVVGCKADGIWSAIKASAILAGARTLTGALVPLVGTAPTNFNFVGADYDRKTGLVGNGSTKYLNSNRNNNADPQDSNHNAVYFTVLGTSGRAFLGAGFTDNGSNVFLTNGAVRNRSSSASSSFALAAAGFFGASRASSTDFIARRTDGVDTTISIASQTPHNANVFVFARNGATPSLSDARLSFYSIGESLNLAQLDSRVSALMTAIDGAIP